MTATLLTAGNIVGLTNGVAVNTASVAPTDDALVLVHLTIHRASSNNPVATTSVAGAGLTFASLAAAAQNYDNAGVSRGRQELWHAQGNASSGVIAITPTFTDAAAGMTWQVIEVPSAVIGANGLTSIVQGVGQAAAGTDDTLAVTLAAFAAPTNHCLGFAALRLTTGTITAGSGFTLLDDEVATTVSRGLAEWRATSDTSPDFTTSAGVGVNGRRMFAIEVAMAAAPQTATGSPAVVNVVARRGRASLDDPSVDNFRKPRRTRVWVHGYTGERHNVVS